MNKRFTTYTILLSQSRARYERFQELIMREAWADRVKNSVEFLFRRHRRIFLHRSHKW